MKDQVDEILRQWEDERPDLDVSPLGILSRIIRLSKHIERNVKAVLAPLELDSWSFDVLAALRRQGKPYGLSPTELRRSALLTSGAMTNRIDRLEERGLVARRANPEDRRAIEVRLTARGLELIDRAVVARLHLAERLAARLDEDNQIELSRLLRKLLVATPNEAAVDTPLVATGPVQPFEWGAQ